MNKIFSTILLMLLCAIAGIAQTEISRGEISAAYSNTFFIEDDPGRFGGVTSRGVNFAGVYNVSRYFGIKGEVTATFSGTDSQRFVPGFDNPTMAEVSFDRRESVNYFVGGVQAKDNALETRWKPFAHAMIGGGQARYRTTNLSCSTVCSSATIPPDETLTGIAYVFGGGLDIKVSRRIDIRAVQLDLAFIDSGEDDVPPFRNGRGDFRFSSGIVFKF